MNIGNIRFDNPFFLAPLAGITDSPFRRICKEQGASLVYSEMISAKGLYYNDQSTERLLKIHGDEKPIAYQIFGSEPEMIAFAAKKLENRENCILDINMGCPVPKVVKNGEGSALLKNPDLIAEIVKAAVEYAGKPVTAKIRIGWDFNHINAVEIAKVIEAAGASAIGVHGRTREQYYTGEADWKIIRQVKDSVTIPVIGNGDVFTAGDAVQMLEETGCDFVMIARGALGNPWIFRDTIACWEGKPLPDPPGRKEKAEMLLKHLDLVLLEKGEYAAVREMRKHAGWYLKGISGSAAMRKEINSIVKADMLRNMILRLA